MYQKDLEAWVRSFLTHSTPFSPTVHIFSSNVLKPFFDVFEKVCFHQNMNFSCLKRGFLYFSRVIRLLKMIFGLWWSPYHQPKFQNFFSKIFHFLTHSTHFLARLYMCFLYGRSWRHWKRTRIRPFILKMTCTRKELHFLFWACITTNLTFTWKLYHSETVTVKYFL